MKTITVTVKLPVENGAFTQQHANIIERATSLFTSQFTDFTTLVGVELAFDVSQSEMNVELNPPDTKMQSIIWAYIYRSIVSIKTPVFKGKEAKLNAVVILPDTWGVHRYADFYDKFISCIGSAYPTLTIDAVAVLPANAIAGDVVLANVHNIGMHHAEEMEYAIKRIGFMLYQEELNAKNT
jgi:hypothetical protein